MIQVLLQKWWQVRNAAEKETRRHSYHSRAWAGGRGVMTWLRGMVSRYAAARQIILIVTICTPQQTDLLMHGCRYVNRHELIISTIGDMLGNEYMILG